MKAGNQTGWLVVAGFLAVVMLTTPGCQESGSEIGVTVNGMLENVNGMDVLWLWGTREQMGYAEGALLCGRVTRVFQELALAEIRQLGLDPKVVNKLIREMVSISDDDQRQLRALLQGMRENCPAEDLIVESDALPRELCHEDLVLMNFARPLRDMLGCSSITVWGEASASGATLHARNFDVKLDPGGVTIDETLVKVYRSSQDNQARWVQVAAPARIGCATCFDENGAGITGHSAKKSQLPSSSDSGFVHPALIREAALISSMGAPDRVEAAERVIESFPRNGGNSQHLSLPCRDADCVGAVVFEHDGNTTHQDGRATVRRPGDVDDGLETRDAMVSTNHYMKRIEERPTAGNSFNRYQALVEGINRELGSDGLDVDEARELMATAAELNDSQNHPTYYTTIMDSSNMMLYLYVAESAEIEAPSTEPYLLDLDYLFSRFPG